MELGTQSESLLPHVFLCENKSHHVKRVTTGLFSPTTEPFLTATAWTFPPQAQFTLQFLCWGSWRQGFWKEIRVRWDTEGGCLRVGSEFSKKRGDLCLHTALSPSVVYLHAKMQWDPRPRTSQPQELQEWIPLLYKLPCLWHSVIATENGLGY